MRAKWVFVVLLAGASAVCAADWSGFRGPDRSGVSKETGLPLEWSATKNILWKRELPGPGASSPIVFGDRVYVTSYSGYGLDPKAPGNLADLKRHLLCVDAKSGQVLWTREETDPDGTDHVYNKGSVGAHGYASHTPVADASGVYAYFGSAGAVFYTHDGERKWGPVRLGGKGKHHGDGSAASPLLHDNLLIVNAVVETAEAFAQGETVALDKKTGKEVWREKVGGYWSSPLLVSVSGKTELVVATHRGQWLGLDPATGKRLWECAGKNDCATPVAHGGVVYTFHESGKMAIRAGGRGDVTKTHKAWEAMGGSRISSPVYHDGHLYFPGLDWNAKCADARTGKVVYNERLGRLGNGGNCYASPILADGRLYYVSCYKGTYVVAAKPELELLAHNTIEDDTSAFNGSPAVSGGKLFLRSDKTLYCIGKK